MIGKLILQDGTTLEGTSFGAETGIGGEVVFSTGMVGYPESLTDPSYLGQILIFTYPIVGSYGVPIKEYWESDSMKISGLIVSDYIDTPSHFHSQKTLSAWLKESNVPALQIEDTRFLAKKIRDKGSMLGKIIFNKDIPFYNPDQENLVAKVSTKKVLTQGSGKKTILLIDGGEKRNITRSLIERGVKVITVPWDYNVFSRDSKLDFDALFISNGPGDPKQIVKTIETVKKSLENKIPTFGVCLGNQLLALAAGGNTTKMKFGHRSQNQPCIQEGTSRCYLTTQNHGFVVDEIPTGFKPWFTNANDHTNEGIIHSKLPFFSVQFHPEVTPGPMDTDWLFDYFIEKI